MSENKIYKLEYKVKIELHEYSRLKIKISGLEDLNSFGKSSFSISIFLFQPSCG